VSLLLERGADLGARDGGGNTVLHYAAGEGGGAGQLCTPKCSVVTSNSGRRRHASCLSKC
jgi:hypothetical protein